jgi:hypothetical protein
MTIGRITTDLITRKMLTRAGWLSSLESIYEKLLSVEAGEADISSPLGAVEELLTWDYTDFECEAGRP